MARIARNFTDGVDGFFNGKRYLIHDRDPLYKGDFLNRLAGTGIESVKLPVGSQNSVTSFSQQLVIPVVDL
jgi:hypothetical protein